MGIREIICSRSYVDVFTEEFKKWLLPFSENEHKTKQTEILT